MGIDPEFKPLLKEWGSEKTVHKFLKTEFDRINRAAFGGFLSTPTLKVEADERNTGSYQAAERHRNAVITIYAGALTDRDTARRVLAHYIVHHWENTLATDNENEDYPAVVDEEISKSFPTGYRERQWRSFHSRRFISKAYDVVRRLSIPIREMLLA